MCDRLTLILRRLSARFDAPEFPPHVTLLGSCVGERRELIRQSAQRGRQPCGPLPSAWKRSIFATNTFAACSFTRR